MTKKKLHRLLKEIILIGKGIWFLGLTWWFINIFDSGVVSMNQFTALFIIFAIEKFADMIDVKEYVEGV